jgi:hypothetical protein
LVGEAAFLLAVTACLPGALLALVGLTAVPAILWLRRHL